MKCWLLIGDMLYPAEPTVYLDKQIAEMKISEAPAHYRLIPYELDTRRATPDLSMYRDPVNGGYRREASELLIPKEDW